jgi:hypothetical protein
MDIHRHGNSILDFLNFRGRPFLKMVENLEGLVVFEVEKLLFWDWRCLIVPEARCVLLGQTRSIAAETWRSPSKRSARSGFFNRPFTFPSHFTLKYADQSPVVLGW